VPVGSAVLKALGGSPIVMDVHAEAKVEVHVNVRHPDESGEPDHVTPPVVEEQLEPGPNLDAECHPMGEAVLAGEEIEEFATEQKAAGSAALGTVLSDFPEHLLVRHRPSSPGNRNGQDEESHNLIQFLHSDPQA
jgi:hypothetical protein